MANRCTELHSNIHAMKQSDLNIIENLLEDTRTNVLIMKTLKKPDFGTLILQGDSVSIREGRSIFDGLIKYPDMEEKISALAKIAENETFESAIANIQDNKKEELTRAEVSAIPLSKFEESFELMVAEHSTNVASIAHLVPKKMRRNDEKVGSLCAIYGSMY